MDNNSCGTLYHWRLNRASLVTRTATGLFMILTVALISATPGFSEERGRERPNRQMVMDRISTKLQLSEQQKATVMPILDEEAGKRRELMDKLREEMERLDRETSARLAKVLSAEQMSQYEKMLEERRNRNGERQSPQAGQDVDAARSTREENRPRPRQ